MFVRDPVDMLSRIVTVSPRAIRASARCEPMKPAPPVMNARIETVYLLSPRVKGWLGFYAGGSQKSARRLGYEKFAGDL